MNTKLRLRSKSVCITNPVRNPFKEKRFSDNDVERSSDDGGEDSYDNEKVINGYGKNLK